MIRLTTVFVAWAALTGARSPERPVPFWQKSWTVTAILGRPSVRQDMQEYVGKPVVLTVAHVETPVSDPCPSAADFRDIQVRSRRELPKHFGRFWQFPAALGTKPLFGWVRCNGDNFGAFAFSDARHGYFFFEEGAVFVLG